MQPDSEAPPLVPEVPIDTARLRLRWLEPADIDAMLAYRSRPDVCRYVPFEPMTHEIVQGRLETDFARRAITAEDQSLTLGIELVDSGILIGDAVVFYQSRTHRGGELGYVLNPDYSGHGYATEACRAMLRLAFADLGLHRVAARIDARNAPSARLAARLGMRQEAHLVRNEMFKGEWSDELVFAILEEEWADRSSS